jgi:predicted RNA-binding Zn-ribbon protein involved in translation (DUF1610 family)
MAEFPMFVEPGKWYFVANCTKCGEPIPFAEAPSPEDDPHPTSGGITMRCPECGFESTYTGLLISRQPGPESK